MEYRNLNGLIDFRENKIFMRGEISMALLGFQKEFAELVRTGQKTQTIRTLRKYPVKVGERLYLYVGLRTKKCEKLGEGICTRIMEIQINKNSVVEVNCVLYPNIDHLDKRAHDDGFSSWEEMRDWFDKMHGIPFEGVLIKWYLVKGEDKHE